MTDAALDWVDHEAEQAVLGALVLSQNDPEVFVAVRRWLPTPAHFGSAAHRELYQALGELMDRGVAIDALTLRDHLAATKRLDAVGGLPYIAAVADAVPTTANAGYHAQIVREWSNRRAVRTQADRLARLAADRELAATDLLTQAIADLTGTALATQVHTPRSWVGALVDLQSEIEEQATRRHAFLGVPSGFAALDRLTLGLTAGEIAVLAARPSMGKTSLALRMARNAARWFASEAEADAPPRHVAIMSCEMTEKRLLTRLLAAESGVAIRRKLATKAFADRDYTAIATAAQALATLPLRTFDRERFDLRTPGQIQLALQHFCATERVPVGLVVVDYLQLLTADTDRENRNLELGVVMNELKAMGQRLGFPVLVLAQLNRESEKAKRRPQLSDLRDSGEIEQTADHVMFLHAEKTPEWEEGKVELLLDKNRDGETGLCPLHFARETQRWTGWQREPGAEVAA